MAISSTAGVQMGVQAGMETEVETKQWASMTPYLRRDDTTGDWLLNLSALGVEGREACSEADQRRALGAALLALTEAASRALGTQPGLTMSSETPSGSRSQRQATAEPAEENLPPPSEWARQRAIAAPADDGDSLLGCGALVLDLDRHEVRIAGRLAPLTASEFRLLRFLIERPGCVQTRAEVLRRVLGTSGTAQTRTVDTHVKRLRQKLGGLGRLIQTVRGVGYRFSAEAAGAERAPLPEPIPLHRSARDRRALLRAV